MARCEIVLSNGIRRIRAAAHFKVYFINAQSIPTPRLARAAEDGARNYAEWCAGTNPTDSADRFEVTDFSIGPP